jgi:hypothetical protein
MITTTFGEMVDETLGYLRSFVRDQELSTHLTSVVPHNAFRIEVADGTVVSRGRVEIGEELIWIDKVDKSTGIAEIPPYGRGMDGTNPAQHEPGTRVVNSPLYPRKMVKDTLNQAIRQIGATLYGVETVEVTAKSNDFKYEMPQETREILSVTMSDTTGYASDVVHLRDYTFDKQAPLLDGISTGKALYLYDGWIGYPARLKITFSRDPLPLYQPFQFFSETRLPDSASDLPVLAAAARLLAASDTYDIQTRSVEANTLDSKVSSTAAQQQSKYLQALYMQRLEEEKLRLLNTYSNRTHYQR